MHDDRPTWHSRTWLAATVAIVAVLCAVLAVGVDSPVAAWAAVLTAVGISVALAVGAALKARSERRHYEAELEQWAAEKATQHERLRIAGDLHDLVSHGLGLITVRAAAASGATGPHGDAERRTALKDIETAGRETTTELRRMLTVLRSSDGAGQDAPLRPAETIDDLPGIVASAVNAGVPAELRVGELDHVSPGVQVAVCATVREALANVLRHAGPARALVEVERDGGEVVVTVTDSGPVPGHRPQPGAGHGLSALRQRAEGMGGRLATSRTGEGFRLRIRLPDGDLR
ncbi:MAG: sensor histidine kinase [Corynebacterium sp.]|uniref:sensor histidine kinase n=1 Tax=unclassified Corynebacterium TaxID=2624378 RepID=UPI0009665119|nr:histidine kinase [Corynebacterium sp. CNJ-954]OLT52795.1 histidine kinase [Corynebacterium sp. CNJ-954]